MKTRAKAKIAKLSRRSLLWPAAAETDPRWSLVTTLAGSGLLSTKGEDDNVLIEEPGRSPILARDDLPKGVAAREREIRADDILDGGHLGARLGLQKHLPGDIHEHEDEGRLDVAEGMDGLLDGLPGG